MEQQLEIWRPVTNYEGLYEVSNLGRVRSLDRIVKNHSKEIFKSGAIKKLADDSKGYAVVSLFKNGKGETKKYIA